MIYNGYGYYEGNYEISEALDYWYDEVLSGYETEEEKAEIFDGN